MSTNTKTAEKNGEAKTPIVEQTNAVSLVFTQRVEKQFSAELGSGVQWTDLQRTLAQHLYVKIDASIKALQSSKPDLAWSTINMDKLALDAVHRVSLGLDALIANHIHVVPYKNNKTGKYDLDLRIGYAGMDYCRRANAVEPPTDVIYQLVHATDEFIPHMRGRSNEIESYDFQIKQPFDRGEVVGGFGYIAYEDPKKNRLIIVAPRDFDRAEAGAQTKDFWKNHRQEMQFKTVVHRVTSKIALDPEKCNAAAWAAIEAEALDVIDVQVDEEVSALAHSIEVPAAAPESAEPY